MYACPECAHEATDLSLPAGVCTCARCGAKFEQVDGQAWIDVARVSNLAEAGFLTDELVGNDIEAQVHHTQEFSALTDNWKSSYLIRVPRAAARDAAARIRQHMAEVEAEVESAPSVFRLMSGEQPIEPLLWKPVVLVLLAGVSSFVLGQRFSEVQGGKADRRHERDLLSTAVQAIDRPFVTENADGRIKHRLQFDGANRSWLLDTDRDGDGRYDSRQKFQAMGASR